MRDDAFDLAELQVWLAEYRESHRAGGPGSGRFSREPRGVLDALASADFAVIDYTFGPWPLAPSEQEARARLLQDFQSTETGLFDETEPDVRAEPDVPAAPVSAARAEPDVPAAPVSAARAEPDVPAAPAGAARAEDRATPEACCRTAYFVAALELLGTRPLRPLRALDRHRTPEGVNRLVEALGSSRPVEAARRAAAVAACFAATGDVGPEWFDRLFDRLAEAADPETGCWPRAGASGEHDDRESALAALSASAGILALHDRFRRPLPHPEKLLAAALGLQKRSGLYQENGPGWTELAAALALEGAFKQCGKKFARVRAALGRLLRATERRLSDDRYREALDADPHRAAAAASLLAVLSRVLPGSVRSARPLRLYLDRHLFV
ncbi:MAG: hypothetical protein ACYTFI_00190 [Planctomycetota bacterium]